MERGKERRRRVERRRKSRGVIVPRLLAVAYLTLAGKEYEYKGRPWERKGRETVDRRDGVGGGRNERRADVRRWRSGRVKSRQEGRERREKGKVKRRKGERRRGPVGGRRRKQGGKRRRRKKEKRKKRRVGTGRDRERRRRRKGRG